MGSEAKEFIPSRELDHFREKQRSGPVVVIMRQMGIKEREREWTVDKSGKYIEITDRSNLHLVF